MVSHQLVDGALQLHVEGMDKVWAFKSQLTIPLEHITAIRVDGEIVKKLWHGFRIPGVNIPYVVTAGTYYQDGKRVFWDVHHPKEAVVISLDHEKYNELVIEVEDPAAFVQEVQERMRAGR